MHTFNLIWTTHQSPDPATPAWPGLLKPLKHISRSWITKTEVPVAPTPSKPFKMHLPITYSHLTLQLLPGWPPQTIKTHFPIMDYQYLRALGSNSY
jgi:hypothetical protein